MADMRSRKAPPGTLKLVALLMEGAKRLGLARHLLRFAFSRMNSKRLKTKAFAGYTANEHDVFAATFAKSGTNWMMQICQQLAWRGDAEFDHIHDSVPWPDAPGKMPVTLEDTSARDASPTGLRVIKTHLEADYVPYDEKAKYLTVIRDPKEVVVSSYYFLGGIMGVLDHVTIHEWFELFLRPNSLGEAWAIHTASFWAWRGRPNVLVLSYGELKQEPRRCISEAAALLGVALTDAQLEKVVERASFEYMRAHESQFSPPPFGLGANETVMIRSGKTGSSDELLSRDQQAAVDAHCREQLRKLGSDFPYAELFGVVDTSKAA